MEQYSVSYIKKCEKTLENLLEMKAKGPPRPPIVLTQDCLYKTKISTRVFKPHQYSKTSWLCGCEDTNKLFCFPCLLFAAYNADSGCESVWVSTGYGDLAHLSNKMKKHAVSRPHMLCEVQLASLGRQAVRTVLDATHRKSIREFNEKVDENRYILRRLIDCVVFCGAFQVAIRNNDDDTGDTMNTGIYKGLIDFVSEIDSAMKQHLNSNSVFKGTSKTIQNDLLDAIYEVCRSEIQTQIKSSEFVAIQADETTDCATNQQLVLIVRYVNDCNIYERFLKFIEPETHSVEVIASEIVKELELLNIDKNKLISQSYDGAAVMTGSFNDVQKIIRNVYPFALYVHCYAHQLNLIVEKSAMINNTLRGFFCNLRAFPLFFTRLQKRSEIIKEIIRNKLPPAQKSLNNYNTNTVKVINNHIEPLKECMHAIMECPNSDPVTYNQAETLLLYLNNDSFLYWLSFFARLMPRCDTLFKGLLSRSIDADKIMEEVYKFEGFINKLCDDIAPPSPKRICFSDHEHISVSNRHTQEVCDIVRSQIKNRFDYMEPLLASKLFYTDRFMQYRKKFPEYDFARVVEVYDFLDASKLTNELYVIYNREEFHNADGAVALLQYFMECSLESVFSESIKLLKVICTTPIMSSETERCFSTLKKIKTFTRNTITNKRRNALCMISTEKHFINSIPDFHNKVTQVFASQKNRRMDFMYK